MRPRLQFSCVVLCGGLLLLAGGSWAGASGPRPQAATVQAAGEAAVEGRFERTIEVSLPLRVDVTMEMGNVQVRTGAPDSVQIIGSIRIQPGRLGSGSEAQRVVKLFEENPPIEYKRSVLRVGRIADRELRRNVVISYDLVVPADTEVRVDTGLGDLTVEGLARAVRLRTGAGNLRVGGIVGQVDARTGLGDIEVRDIRGVVRAVSGGGHIRAQSILEGDWKLDTGLGDVTVRVPEQMNFELHARSGLGLITARHPLTQSQPIRPGELHGKVRGGGVRLDVSTGLGAIRIE